MGLFVTGSLGDSAAGLALLADPRYAGLKEKGYARRLIRRHRLPEPRVEEALALAESLGEWAAMDLSDDLGRSVSLLARASGVCVEAESSALPVSRELIAFERDAAGMGERASAEGPAAPRRWAIGGGGEDYELLFAAAAELEELRAAFRRRGLRRAISRIGAISACPKGGARLDRRPWPCQGFEHFR